MPKGTCLSKWNDEAATRWSSVLPRCNSICGKQSAAEYTREPVRCKLVCSSNGFSQMCVLQGTLYLQIGYGQATETALPRRNSICGKQSAAEYTREPARCKLVCASNGFSQMCVLQGTLISPNRMRPGNGKCSAEVQQYMRQAKRSRIYAGIQASEPEQNPKNSLQLIERFSVVWFQQASPLVQMQRKMGASEPCSKAESGSQAAHNKRVARLSATVPVVQIPDGFGAPRNANVLWRHFWQGYPPNTQQSGPSI